LPPATIHIQSTPEPKPATSKNLSDDIYFKPGEESVTVYTILRDKYGNPVGTAVSKPQSANDWGADNAATWISTDPKVATFGGDNNTIVGGNATVQKGVMGEGAAAELIVRYEVCYPNGSAKKCEVLSDTVSVGSERVGQIAIVPNPFIPGVGVIWDNLAGITHNPGRLERLYGPIVAYSKSGGGNGQPYDVKGVLVTAIAPKSIMTKGGISDVMYVTDAKAMIYDAVGRVVFKSESGDIVTPDGNTFGFVWNGKNTAGKTVESGTYLMRMTAAMTNGEKFSCQRMIGVTVRKGGFSMRKSPASKLSGDGAVGFFWEGDEVLSGTLLIYDASGNVVKKIGVYSKSTDDSGKRKIGEWDLTNTKGRIVSDGGYLVTGTIKSKDGKKERVSAMIGVGR